MIDRTRLALGGHCLVPLAPTAGYHGPALWRCVRCHGIIPAWQTTPLDIYTTLGRICRELLAALPESTRPVQLRLEVGR